MELTVQKRDTFGKAVKKLRAEGIVPGELYGKGIANIHVSVSVKELKAALLSAGESSVVNLVLSGEKHPVLIHDIDKNPVTGEYYNVDFYEVNMKEKVTTHVPLVFIGESPAVKHLSGLLVTVMDEVEVEALPADLPPEITVDLSSLDELNKAIHLKDIILPNGVEITGEGEAVVVKVTEQRAEEVAAPVVDVSEVKVEGEEKRAEKDGARKEESMNEN